MNNKGFSLLELIVIVSIMAALIIIAIPATRSWRAAAQDREMAREVLSWLRHARSQSVTDGQNYTVTIDLDNKTYTTYSGEVIDFPLQTAIESKVNIGDAWSSSGNSSVTFRAQGSCTSTLFVRVQQKDNLVIRLDSTATGLARL